MVENLKAATAEESDVLLIIDQPDLLLAATGPNRGIGATEMGEWVLGLQEVCCLLILGCTFTFYDANEVAATTSIHTRRLLASLRIRRLYTMSQSLRTDRPLR